MSTPQSLAHRRAAASALLALFAGIPAVFAQSVWNGTTGNWSVAGNWSGTGLPSSGSSTVLQFNNAASAYTATNDLAGDFQLNSIIFGGSAANTVSIARSGTQSLNFVSHNGTASTIHFNSTSTSSKTINVPMILSADLTVTNSVNGNGNLQLGAMSGAGKLILDFGYTGSGGVLLSAASSHSGGVTLERGRIYVGNNSALGSGAFTLAGGAMRTTAGATSLVLANPFHIAGSASIFEASSSNSFAFSGGGSIQGTNTTHTLTFGNAANTLTLGGAFTGSGNGLTLAGSGGLTLGSGASDTAGNTFNGATTVSGATLSLNKAAGVNALAGNLVVSAGTVSWARSHQIADTASLTMGGGTVTLAQGLSETLAATTLSAGAFTVAKDATFTTGSLAVTTAGSRTIGGAIEIGSGGLSITHDGNTSSTRNAFTLFESATSAPGVLRLGGDLTFANSTGASTKVQITRSSGTGYIDLGGAARTFTIADGAAAEDLEISVRLTNGGLVKEGAGVLAFLNTASDYADDTRINAGTIRATTINTTPQVFSTQSTYVLADNAGVTLDLNNINQTVGGLSGGGATGGAVTLGTATLTAGNNNASTTFAGAITGTGGLTKTGSGALTLSSDLGYTGATLVSAGTLVVNGQLASSGVTLNGATAVLGGSGRVNALTLTQGTFAPGNSPGAFTVDGNVSFGAASVFSVEAASASSFDQLIVNGASSTVTIASGASLVLSGFESLPALATGTEFLVLVNHSANSISGTFLGYDEGHSFTLGANTFAASYQLGAGGNDFGFTVTSAIPEPSAFAALAGLAVLAVATRRRR